MSLNKCIGCGVELQNLDENKPGFVKKEDQKYCQRCFKLVHYGDTSSFKLTNYNNQTLKIINKFNNALFVYIVDCYEGLLLDNDLFLDNLINNEVIVIINKIDLLPSNINDEKINITYNNIYSNLAKKYNNISEFVLTHKKDVQFINLFFEILGEKNYKDIVFIGKTNVGKSSIINKLTNNSQLTTSIYPGTTVDYVSVKHDKYQFIDTPGLEDNDSFTSYLSYEELEEITKYKTIKPQVFQVYEPQTYFVSGLFNVSVKPKNRASIIFESSRDDIHRTKYENKENYFEKNNKYFKLKFLPWTDKNYIIKKKKSFIIKGFGLIRVIGDCEVTISINDKIKIYQSEVDI